MAQGLPCPNPTCTHEFAADAVKGVAALSCPRCGTVFQFRSGGTPAPPPTPTPIVMKPAASRPVPQRPAPSPSPPVIPVAMPVQPIPQPIPSPISSAAPSLPTPSMAEMLAPPDDFTTPNVNRVAAKSKPKSKGRPRSWIGWGVVALALLLLIGLPVASWYAGLLDGLIADQGDFTRGGEYTSPHFNYRFKLPARDWKQDPATGELTPKVKLKAPVTLRRTDPNSWLALSLVKNDKRTPQEAELIDEGVSRLRAYFKDLEFEQTTERLGKPIVLGGRPAVRVVFRAEAGDVMMVGECLMVAHQGIAYWLTTWAPEMFADQVFDEWERLREGFAILKDRDGWQEKKPQQIPLLGTNASYAMSYSEGLWERRKAIDYDSLADAALHGRDETEPTHADKTATALVLVLPAAEDLKSAAAAARAHLEMRQKAEYKDSTFEDVAEKKAKLPDGPPDEVGDAPGRILKLHVKNGESRERFVYLGVVPLAEQVLVIQCDCDWRRRTYWEVNFVNLIRTLRVKK